MTRRQEPRGVDLASGAHIQYLDIGNGAPVVFFHGAGGVFRNAAFMPALGQRYRVLAPSRPGYDGSTGASASPRDDAVIMAEFIRQTVAAPVHLIAESAGGAAGCWFALLEPSRLESLVLVAPSAFAGSPPPPPPASPEALELPLFGPKPAWSEPPRSEERRVGKEGRSRWSPH